MKEEEVNKIMNEIFKDENLCIIRNALENFGEENNYCCNKKMVKSFSYFNGADYESETCLECGSFKTITEGQLDEEELDNLREQEGGLK